MNQQPMGNPKPAVSKWLWITLVIVIIAAGGLAAWYFFMGPGKKVETSATTLTTKPKTTTAPSATTHSDWLTYTNKTFGYSIKYPKELSYEENSDGKDMFFQTAQEKTAYQECMKKEGTECLPGSGIRIGVDLTTGTTSTDDLASTLEQIIQKRIKNLFLAEPIAKTTLAGQPAYEAIGIGMLTSYQIVSKYNNHIYELLINCDTAVKDINTSTALNECKSVITTDQKKMIESFSFKL